jgi:hypothetical protein
MLMQTPLAFSGRPYVSAASCSALVRAKIPGTPMLPTAIRTVSGQHCTSIATDAGHKRMSRATVNPSTENL